MSWVYKILLLIFALFLVGFYFGDVTVGFINIKDKLRASCECQILLDIEEFVQERF